MNRLLVLSCSQCKRIEDTKLPALQRYNGPAFQLLRRYLENTVEEIGIYILSAEFGLIPHNRLIPFYDQRMTKQRAHELKAKVAGQAQRLFAIKSQRRRQKPQLFINLGSNYLRAFEPTLNFLASSSIVTMASGASGKRLAEMHDWLYGSDLFLRQLANIKSVAGEAKLRGVEIDLNKDQVFACARKALKQDDGAAFSYQSWYVRVDGVRVAPKWLVSLLTGLPVGSFHSDEARRVLSQLGMKVMRV
jgi:hypothetical protein